MNIKNDVHAVIDGIKAGKVLETFDQYYADDIVMSENGLDERIGKDNCRKYEEQFVNNVEFHAASTETIIIEGDKAAVEWTLDFTLKGGNRVVQNQVAIQTWKDGKVIKEVFYHG